MKYIKNWNTPQNFPVIVQEFQHHGDLFYIVNNESDMINLARQWVLRTLKEPDPKNDSLPNPPSIPREYGQDYHKGGDSVSDAVQKSWEYYDYIVADHMEYIGFYNAFKQCIDSKNWTKLYSLAQGYYKQGYKEHFQFVYPSDIKS